MYIYYHWSLIYEFQYFYELNYNESFKLIRQNNSDANGYLPSTVLTLKAA